MKPRIPWRSAARAVRGVGHLFGLFRAYVYDAWSYARGSGLLREGRPRAAAAQVLKTAHRLEKGWALPHPRLGFGSEAVVLLRRQLQQHIAANGHDWVAGSAQETLERHRHFLQGVPAHDLSLHLSAEQTRLAARGAFEQLVHSRRSVRQFAATPLPPGCLERAAALAAQSPSACNRSGGRVWVTTDPERRRQVLALQDGHQGFAHQAAAIAVITTDVSVFHTVGERHQAWIDGGLFAMTFIYALHHEGLGTCCLNWCVEPAKDRAFKQALGLPAHEAILMMLAIGRLPEHYTVAHSPRRPVSDVLRTLEKTPC